MDSIRPNLLKVQKYGLDESTHSCCISHSESHSIKEEIISEMRKSGMRKSDALDALLEAMLSTHKPFLLAELAELPSLKGRDQATIYRLVTKLREAGLVRQLNFGDRGNYFQLNVADHHHDYLLCQDCGELSEVPFPCVVNAVEERLRQEIGWSDLSHSLAFHGRCPDCQDS